MTTTLAGAHGRISADIASPNTEPGHVLSAFVSIYTIGRKRPTAWRSNPPTLILFDDIVDSGTTLCSAAKSLAEAGALEVSAYITHGVLSGQAVERVNASVLKELVVTDSIATEAGIQPGGKIRVVSCARLIGEAIRRIANEESVSKLFD
jgi:hypothetical protein